MVDFLALYLVPVFRNVKLSNCALFYLHEATELAPRCR